MATINITVQSLLHFNKYDLQIVDTAGTIGELKTAMETNFSYSADWFDLIFRNQTLDPAQTIGSYGIVEGSQLRIHNKIARLATKQLRQIAKLDLAALDRADSGKTRSTYDITQLPDTYNGNVRGADDNPNTGGLVVGRPWVSITLGLYRTKYDGFFNDDPAWFDTATVLSEGAVTDFSIAGVSTTQSYQWIGYFTPDVTGTWTFGLAADDIAYIWIGPEALSGYTTSNQLAYSNNDAVYPITKDLIAGVPYPIRVQYGNNGGPGSFEFIYEKP